MHRPRLRISAGAFLAFVSVSCQAGGAENPAPPQKGEACVQVDKGNGPAGSTPLQVETVADGLVVPWGIAFLPGGEMLVTERGGALRLIRDGKLVADPVARVPVVASGESGLMGITAHPDFATNRLFYVAITAESEGKPENRVERWKLADDGSQATRDKVILGGIPAHRFHDGGRIRIGPDRKLYVSTGDAGEPNRSQDPRSLAGKILRLGLDGEIPADNPTPGSAVFLSGIRNSQGFDWLDDATLVVTDHGPSGELGRRGGDELNVAKAGDNLGWPTIWRCEEAKGMTTPILTWVDAVPSAGVAVFRGDSIPGWDGSVLFSTLGSRHLHRAVLDEKNGYRLRSHEVYFQGDPPSGLGRLREAILGPDGFLYLTTSNCDGRGACPTEKDRIVRILPGA